MEKLKKINEDFHFSYQTHSRDYLLEYHTVKFFKKWEKPIMAVLIVCVALLAYRNFHV